ncbi:PHD finger protein 1, partial [Camarhynchus parvulus]|uniref:PHD finger protein 1 n=1 Tax=Geospiza parvula TaxID=87175 RepID=UPI001237FE1E
MEAAEGGAPPPSPPRPPQVGEGQDVLARWTDGLLYLGVVKKVDAPRRGCLIQFEDNSQFFVLWKDISPAAVPGDDPSCCVCAGNSRNPENSLVRCGKCGHAYHQRCHVPPAPGGAAPWSCRRCVFAVATKRGGALRRGPQARAMLRMKSVLPYALAALDWDPPHLHNLQHCYCYCGGPGHWNLKMLQCRRCRQWFHEACTQCLTRPLLYGDRFYVFECSVCRGGAESVRRLPLRWVDVAHLLLYHLSVCCKRKYFDLEREILPFANSNWGAAPRHGGEQNGAKTR